jgi:hypothetical protein
MPSSLLREWFEGSNGTSDGLRRSGGERYTVVGDRVPVALGRAEPPGQRAAHHLDQLVGIEGVDAQPAMLRADRQMIVVDEREPLHLGVADHELVHQPSARHVPDPDHPVGGPYGHAIAIRAQVVGLRRTVVRAHDGVDEVQAPCIEPVQVRPAAGLADRQHPAAVRGRPDQIQDLASIDRQIDLGPLELRPICGLKDEELASACNEELGAVIAEDRVGRFAVIFEVAYLTGVGVPHHEARSHAPMTDGNDACAVG